MCMYVTLKKSIGRGKINDQREVRVLTNYPTPNQMTTDMMFGSGYSGGIEEYISSLSIMVLNIERTR